MPKPFDFRGLDLTNPLNRIKSGFTALCVNVRAYLRGGFALRNQLSTAIYTLSSTVRTIARMNDTTPSGPVSGYTLISVDGHGNLYNNGSVVASNLSGNPVSLIPFQPNQSVEPWMYVGDTSQIASIPYTATLINTPTLTATSSTGWSNPSNALSTISFTTCPGSASNFLNIVSPALTLPSGSIVVGIAMTGQGSVATTNGNIAAFSSPGGVNRFSPVFTIASSFLMGGPADLWGMTSAQAIAGFTLIISPNTSFSQTFSINNVVITIYYTLASSQACTGMVKVRSDGLTRKTGIEEPQSAPLVNVNTINTTFYLTLPATTPPWTNILGANPNYNYSGTDPQPPFPATISTPVPGTTVVIQVSGTATVNGASHAPGDSGPSSTGYPGNFITSPKIVVFAFTDSNGNIVAPPAGGGSPPVVGNIGAGATLIVPPYATQLQIGIDSQGGDFADNAGSYLIQAAVQVSAITQVASILGNITAYIWGDSPHSGPVATYIWKNPNDSGTGISRTIDTAQATAQNNSLIMDSTPEDGTVPVQWTTLNFAGSTVGTIALFSPALESEGYQDFNVCVVGSFWIPAGGTYSITIQFKDQIMFGIGGGASSTEGAPAPTGPNGQTITVVSGLPLIFVSSVNGTGGAQTYTVTANFPGQGIYPFEIDWDYWYHSGRSLIVKMSPTPGAGVALIPPLPPGVRTEVQYWGKYRATETGAQSNPGPASPIQQTPVLANSITQPWSPDPQVTVWDCYRQDSGLPNPTYVATGPNDGRGGTINGIIYNTPIEDTLTDLAAANNQLMARDDFEPFPSIDTPKSGMVTITAGVVTWVSGDKFNVRWLAGTLMLIGYPTQNAYALVARPLSTTQLVIPDIPDTIGDSTGAGVPYNIAQPILAQQPLPYLFGPSDNIPFAFAVGDPLRPGTIYWSKGNNLDSAPDTNQQNLTDPSEALVNGAMSGGYAIVFSIKRAWVVVPNFFNALATTTGTSGSTWTFRSTEISRGLFIPRCLAVEGSGKTFFRVDDGIHFSQSGGPSVSITDDSLYPLFQHEGSTPTPITRNGTTIYPPNDSKPQNQQFNIQGPYLYYDYMGTDSLYHTLTFDIVVMAWTLDSYAPSATTHTTNQGLSVQGVLVGCVDGTIRSMATMGSNLEFVTGTVATPAIGGTGWQHIYQLTVEYTSNIPITLSFAAVDSGNGSYGPNSVTLATTSGIPTKYTFKVSANKWKWLQAIFTFTDPGASVYIQGMVADVKDWGSAKAYRPVLWFTPSGGEGGEL